MRRSNLYAGVFFFFFVAASNAGAVTIIATEAVLPNAAVYHINPATGAWSVEGNYALVNVGGESGIGGLAFDENNVLYGLSVDKFVGGAAHLYTMNPFDGTAAPVGPLNIGVFTFEGGIAFDPTDGVLYAVNASEALAPHLFTIDKNTGLAGIPIFIGGGPHDFNGLVFDANGELFGIDRESNALWHIDKNNPGGLGTQQVGPVGLGAGIVIGSVGGLTRDPDTGIVYGYSGKGDGGSRHLFTLNLANGQANILHQFNAGTVPDFRAIEVIPNELIPEPSTFVLAALGLVGLALYGWRRKRKLAA